MTANLLDLVKAYLNETIIDQVSETLGENRQNTQNALTATLPTVLGGIIQKASEPGGTGLVMDLVAEVTTPNRAAGEVIVPESGLMGHLDELFTSKTGELTNLLSMGAGFITSIFGDKSSGIATAIAKYSNIKQSSASSLMSLAGPVLLSLIGKQIADTGSGPSGLGNFLSSQTGNVQTAIPPGLGLLLSSIPGLGLLGGLASKSPGTVSTTASPVLPVQTVPAATKEIPSASYTNDNDKESDSGNRWLPWLMLALGVVALFYFMRSCQNDGKSTASATADSISTGMGNAASDVAVVADSAGSKVEAVADSVGETVADATAKLGAFFKRKLPSGSELNIPENGIENNLVKFIEDKDKPVDQTTWFNFDRLLFDTGKATLKPSSQEQVVNMAEILKAFPQVAIKVGGYTDNTGSADINKKLSQERADAVKNELVKLGISGSRLEVEGYGPEHPTASNDTAEGRAENRRIAVRVTKK